MRTSFRLVGYAVAMTALLSCHGDKPEHGNIQFLSDRVALLPQGWDQSTREAAWFTSFGSKLMPRQWFLHLEQAERQAKFREDETLRQLGLMPAPKSKANPDALPIGLTIHQADNQQWIGLGCAACHSGQIRFRDLYLHIDGGAAMFDYQAFEREVIRALAATLTSNDKFLRFANNIHRTDTEALKSELQTLHDKLQTRATMNHSALAYGHGRLDAFGQIFNAVTAEFLNIPGNAREPNAPVSFPVLWDASHLDVVQWNASAPNEGPGPLMQNATTALAVFGELDPHGNGALGGYRSNIAFDALGDIEKHWYSLTAPRWPESLFGVIDADKRQSGAELYQQHCLQCHELSDAQNPKRKLQARKIVLSEIGTDPRMVENFLNSDAETGAFKGKKLFKLAGPEFGERAPSIQLVAHATFGALLEHPIAAIRAGIQSFQPVIHAAIDQHPNYYKARPLSGIWSSAPYLHNGSVANLRELLTPAAQRVKQFSVGDIEFDPIAVGFPATVSEDSQNFLFDTELPGNLNTGHQYGTTLSENDKQALLEYLKSL